MQSAEYEDRSTIASLRMEQQSILSAIRSREGSIKSKVQRFALILEERLKLADETLAQEQIFPSTTIQQISTIISRLLSQVAPSTAAHVCDYLTGNDPN